MPSWGVHASPMQAGTLLPVANRASLLGCRTLHPTLHSRRAPEDRSGHSLLRAGFTPSTPSLGATRAMQRRGAVSAAAQLQAAACSSAAIGAAPLAALLQRLDAAGQRCGIHADTLQAANEQQDAQQQQQQQQHQQRRRLSHCAATPSGRASSDPAHGRSRRGLSTSAAAAAAAQRSSSGAPSERSYSAAAAAAEPALAFDAAPDAALPHVTFSDPAAAAATAARLRAQANARLKAMTLADPQPRRRMVPAADEPGEMELRRVAVPLTNGSTPERPVWERLAAARAAADAAGSELQSESAAALQLYRQEVLHGHDVSVPAPAPACLLEAPALKRCATGRAAGLLG